MPPLDTALDQNEYRVVLVKSGSHAIWAENKGEMWRLPRIAIPRWTRPVEKLQQAIEKAWRLCCVVVDFLPGNDCSAPCVVAEILPSHFPHGLTATGIDEISRDEMTSEEREVVEEILIGETGTRGPFSRVTGANCEALSTRGTVAPSRGRNLRILATKSETNRHCLARRRVYRGEFEEYAVRAGNRSCPPAYSEALEIYRFPIPQGLTLNQRLRFATVS
jgi:hypothetical protein